MKKFRLILKVILALAVLMTVLGFEENWRGERDWAAYVQEHDARGERIDFQPLISQPVPDDKNFAMTPLLAPIFGKDPSYADRLKASLEITGVPGKTYPLIGNRVTGVHFDLGEWQAFLGGDVLVWMKRYDEEMREISEAARRPYARFPVEYGEGPWTNLPHLVLLGDLLQLYIVRACAELNAGKTDEAFEDTRTIFLLAESIKDEPLLIPQVIRIGLWQMGLQVMWEGLDGRKWNAEQISVLQADLARVDFLQSFQMALHGERASLNMIPSRLALHPEWARQGGYKAAGQLSHYAPNGIFDRMLLDANLCFEKYVFNVTDISSRRIHKEAGIAEENGVAELMRPSFLGIRMFNPYEVLAAIMVPAIRGVSLQIARLQSTTDQAVIACALERYRLANGRFPDALEKLIPEYIQGIPSDLVNGEKPRYHLNNNGTYMLYSVGWSGEDNGGKLVMKPDGSSLDSTKTDWIWSNGRK